MLSLRNKWIVVAALCVVVAIPVLLLCFENASAEPYIAVRTGKKCSTCHVNQTGGGMRSGFGVIYSQTTLPMRILRPEGRSGFIDNRLSRSVSIGGDLRVDEEFVFEYTNSQGETFPASNASGFNEANLYVKVDLVPDMVAFYADQTLAPSASNRELFGIISSQQRSAWLKVGRMLLPYGLRLIDNDAFIRSRTGYTYANSGTGIELGWQPGAQYIYSSLTEDNFSIVAAWVYRRFQVGGSFGRNTTQSNDGAIGPFAGVNLGRFTLLGEVDWIANGSVDQLAALAEVNYLITKGFNIKFTYEFFDRDQDVPNENDGQARYTFGVEPFLVQFVQLKAFYRINDFIPQNGPENQNQALLEFHVFF